MPENSEKLEMSFDPNTIEHLGIQMYATLPPVLSELISNSYDADANKVTIQLFDDDPDNKRIVVADDGLGMSFKEINSKFLVIGRNRRAEEAADVTPSGRKVIGNKGLGKLSFFGIANEIVIETIKGGLRNKFSMNIKDIEASSGSRSYEPRIIVKDEPCSEAEGGTVISLEQIQRSSDFDSEGIATTIARRFNLIDGFEIFISHNGESPIEVKTSMRYRGLTIQVEWNIPDDIPEGYDKLGFFVEHNITGKLIATETPLPPSKSFNGITLLSRNKLVNEPSYFEKSTSSHFFQYLTGWLNVDYVEELGLRGGVIDTSRKSLMWENEELQELQKQLADLLGVLERDWRTKRAKVRAQKAAARAGVSVPDWMDTIPESKKDSALGILEALTVDTENDESASAQTVKMLQDVLPPYTTYHYRFLHPEVQRVSGDDYKRGDYYEAFLKAYKAYELAVRVKFQRQDLSDVSLFQSAFSVNPGCDALSVTDKLSQGYPFTSNTIKNIQIGNMGFSVAVAQGCRNPVVHEDCDMLKDSGMFSEQDCLDALGVISHLFRRLDNAVLQTNS